MEGERQSHQCCCDSKDIAMMPNQSAAANPAIALRFMFCFCSIDFIALSAPLRRVAELGRSASVVHSSMFGTFHLPHRRMSRRSRCRPGASLPPSSYTIPPSTRCLVCVQISGGRSGHTVDAEPGASANHWPALPLQCFQVYSRFPFRPASLSASGR